MTTEQQHDRLWGIAWSTLGEDYIRAKLAERDRERHYRRIAARRAGNSLPAKHNYSPTRDNPFRCEECGHGYAHEGH